MIGPVELIVAAFQEEDKAEEVLNALKQLEKEEIIDLVNAAVITKDDKGKVAIKETQDVRAGRGALFGAVAGGLIGLLGGPAGVVIGAAAGAATGGVAASKIDMGFPDDTLEELQEALTPGSSAILALIQQACRIAVNTQPFVRQRCKQSRQVILNRRLSASRDDTRVFLRCDDVTLRMAGKRISGAEG